MNAPTSKRAQNKRNGSTLCTRNWPRSGRPERPNDRLLHRDHRKRQAIRGLSEPRSCGRPVRHGGRGGQGAGRAGEGQKGGQVTREEKISALLSKTQANGCTEGEERAA